MVDSAGLSALRAVIPEGVWNGCRACACHPLVVPVYREKPCGTGDLGATGGSDSCYGIGDGSRLVSQASSRASQPVAPMSV